MRRWGSEPWFTGEWDDLVPLERCPCCGAGVGAAHHTICDKAHCDVCDGQALGCDCHGPYDDEDDG